MRSKRGYLHYWCINSNMFQSIIIAFYAGAHLLLAFVYGFKKITLKNRFQEFQSSVYYMYMVYQLDFESQGGRSTGCSDSSYWRPHLGNILLKGS